MHAARAADSGSRCPGAHRCVGYAGRGALVNQVERPQRRAPAMMASSARSMPSRFWSRRRWRSRSSDSTMWRNAALTVSFIVVAPVAGRALSRRSSSMSISRLVTSGVYPNVPAIDRSNRGSKDSAGHSPVPWCDLLVRPTSRPETTPATPATAESKRTNKLLQTPRRSAHGFTDPSNPTNYEARGLLTT